MSAPIKDILIIGGGTTGWLVAAHMNHRLQWGLAHPDGVRVTLVESPTIPTIGVGESTIPPLRAALNGLQIDEAEFIARTQATFKLGVRFKDWDRDAQGRGGDFFHPFSGGVQVADRNPAASLLAYGIPDGTALASELAAVIGHCPAAVAAFRSPRQADGPPYKGALNYAYHFDAGLFADFLREICVARGVEHVRDTVIGVERADKGHIAAIQLADGGRRPVELVIDCSGFRGVAIQEALGEPFLSYADYLPNDRAIAIQVAHDADRALLPATVATASDAGWSWRIPLRSRVGTGHVFCSAFMTDDQAADALIARNGSAAQVTEPRAIAMRVGRVRRSFVGNCVAIGLSGGFLEPLESTSIQFVDYACRRLLRMLPSRDFEPAPIAKFNREMATLYDEVRDFLSLHFTLGNREDTPYWRTLRHDAKRSDGLLECLDLWRHALPDSFDPRASTVFSAWSVSCVLFGKGFYAGPIGTGTDILPLPQWQRFTGQMAAMQHSLVQSLPDHATALDAIVQNARAGHSATRAPPTVAVPGKADTFGLGAPIMTAVPLGGIAT